MAALLQTERDAEGVQMAVRELFEEAFFDEAMKSVMRKTQDEVQRERVHAERPPRTLSPGYYDRASFLLTLGSSIESGAQYSAAQLTHTDVVGLAAVKRARSEFERDHPPCPSCGTRQDSAVIAKCKRCRAKLAVRGMD